MIGMEKTSEIMETQLNVTVIVNSFVTFWLNIRLNANLVKLKISIATILLSMKVEDLYFWIYMMYKFKMIYKQYYIGLLDISTKGV